MKVLKFGAVWCSGCLVMRPRWAEIEKENPWLKTEYYDYDQDRSVATRYGIVSKKLPVFIFLDKRNQEFLRLNGEVSQKKLLELLTAYKNR
jgi:thiol-disulfide isomerase/thioredoxin